MRKTILPIEIELGYKTEKEKETKINIIKELLTEIIKSKEKFNDIKKLNKFLSIIKGKKQPFFHYFINILISILFVIIISVIILGISIHNGQLVSNIYLGGKTGYGYYLTEINGKEKLGYGNIIINGCNNIACNTNKGIVIKRYIDYYSIF